MSILEIALPIAATAIVGSISWGIKRINDHETAISVLSTKFDVFVKHVATLTDRMSEIHRENREDFSGLRSDIRALATNLSRVPGSSS